MKFGADSLAYSVKVALNGEMRRFTHEGTSYKELVARVIEVFGLSTDEKLRVQYKDDEGDDIALSSDLELQEAVVISANVLRITVTLQSSANDGTRCTTAIAPASVVPSVATAAPDVVAALGNANHAHHDVRSLRKQEKVRAKEERQLWKMQNQRRKEEWKQRKHSVKGDWKAQKEGKFIARHVKDITVEDGTELPPNTPFVKTWRVRNEGPAWPAGCRLLFISRNGDNLGGPEFVTVPGDGPIQQGQEVDISVPLVSPSSPGRYVGYWKLCTPEGRKFGQRLWVSIMVPSSSSSSDETDISAEQGHPLKQYEGLADVLAEMGFDVKKKIVLRLLHKHAGDVDKVVMVLNKRGKGLKKGRKDKVQPAEKVQTTA